MRCLLSAAMAFAMASSYVSASDGIVVSNGCIEGVSFEFAVNGEVLGSAMPVWKYVGSEDSDCPNGAAMTTYHFTGRGRFGGLHVFVDRQTFPDGDFIRERMRLQSSKQGKYKFTDVEGQNHFVFPTFTVPSDGKCIVKEIKIGNFVTKPAKGNHTYFPTENEFSLSSGNSADLKGPVVRIITSGKEYVSTYEHASQDVTLKYKRTADKEVNGMDAAQGVTGNMDIITPDDLWYIATKVSAEDRTLKIENRIRHGAYVDGEAIPSKGYYETVWYTFSSVPEGKTFTQVMNDYLFTKICSNPVSRKPDFYYNTWAMQREMPPDQLRSVINEENILKDIQLASELGVDIYVIDDGWQSGVGIWKPSRTKFPDGLEPVVKAMKDKGITPGIWLSLLGIQGNAQRLKEHPDWVIRDKSGDPLQGQYGHPVFDLGTGVYDLILQDLKDLVDMGFRFFKWDAINTFSSAIPRNETDGKADVKERMARYNYLLPFYVCRLMRELREYNPEVSVEIDVTEDRRALMGLMMLQEGKFFFVNNGASAYKDFTVANARSKRRATTEMGTFLPPELLTFAVYPHNQGGTLKYNVHTVLASGHGFWGCLDAATSDERAWIREVTGQAKRVLAHTAGNPLSVAGGLGDSPQTFVQSDVESGYALVTAFTVEPVSFKKEVFVNKPLAVVGRPFTAVEDKVTISFELNGEVDSDAAFVIGNDDRCRRVLSSTGILKDVSVRNGYLHLLAGTDTDVLLEGENETRHIDAGREMIVGMVVK